MATSSQLLVQTIRDVTVVSFDVATILEMEQVQRIGRQLYRLVDDQARKKIVLDFSKVRSLSSSALGVLITLRQKADDLGGQIVVCGLRKDLMHVFKISNLDKMFKFSRDEEQALATFGVTTAG